MNDLNRFRYLEDTSMPEDPLWVRSFEILRDAVEVGLGDVIKLTNPMDRLSVDYDRCWNVGATGVEKLWIPGYHMDGVKVTLTGKRPLRTLVYTLCQKETSLRGSKLIQCCENPYCINPAHTFVVTNKYKLYDQVYLGVAPEEWEDIRGEILKLIDKRSSDQAVVEVSSQNYVGTPNAKLTYMNKVKRDNPYYSLTNDQIATMAIQRGAANVNTSIEFGSFDGFLQTYQLKGIYHRGKQGGKDLIELMVPSIRQSDYMSLEDFYKDTLVLVSKLYNEHEMILELIKFGWMKDTQK